MNSSIEFEKVDPLIVKDSELSFENQTFLKQYGFLGWVSPHLYFGGFENDQILPYLKNWTWIADWNTDKKLALEKYGNMIVIGCGPDNEPFVVEPRKSLIYMVSESLELLPLNANLQNLAATASAFLDMVDKALDIHLDAAQKCVVPFELVNEFISNFEEIEKQVKGVNLWVQWANERSENL
ncbi:hypothetical protein [Pseudoalteromonas carrageenovora]|uniref:hypothetical protein n=1 Tax=Pseudoalteromonas carrageenovora TaxID=227 RepID=UPI0026E2C548|nr:hypothetical protein [Pseudoalteromonas carrageenovora]MDO6465350.1 hypothetical protein [Pseudoalteromonas carrageenovora]